MDCFESMESSISDYKLLFEVASRIPKCHYILLFTCVFIVVLYNLLEFHLLEDLFTGGSPVMLTYNPASELYHRVASKCSLLHRRYFATPWLSSPHLQTILLEFVGKPLVFSYKRQLFPASDGGTFALDWLMSFDVLGSRAKKDDVSKKDTTPIVVVIPGLTSDSACFYIKHLAYNMAKHGWNVVVCNHRGMGGVPFTSNRTYNAGWTTDLRNVIRYLCDEYPEAPLYAIGTSVGANILVKYLGEDGASVPLVGAIAVCCPWDLLIDSRYIVRRLAQKVYDFGLALALKSYAQANQEHFTRLADWEGILKCRTLSDFNKSATCVIDKFETADAYYRWSSSAPYTKNVSVPLLCISALDDPVCTNEAIPWHEIRANKNIVLATTKHGGHLGFFEGIKASNLWWVRAINEFLLVLHYSPLNSKIKHSTHMHKQKKMGGSEHAMWKQKNNTEKMEGSNRAMWKRKIYTIKTWNGHKWHHLVNKFKHHE